MAEEVQRVKVRSGYAGTRDENRAAFSDPSTVHGPDGAFVYGSDEFEVAVTPEVLDAIRHDRLVIVEGPGANAESEEDKVPEELVEMVVSANEGAELQAETQDEEAGNKPESMSVEVDGEVREGMTPTGTTSESFAAVPPADGTGKQAKAAEEHTLGDNTGDNLKISEVDPAPRKGKSR